MSVDEIEKEITKLSSQERTRLLKLLAEMDADEWDRQFERDVKSGKINKLIEESEEDFKAGNYREL